VGAAPGAPGLTRADHRRASKAAGERLSRGVAYAVSSWRTALPAVDPTDAQARGAAHTRRHPIGQHPTGGADGDPRQEGCAVPESWPPAGLSSAALCGDVEPPTAPPRQEELRRSPPPVRSTWRSRPVCRWPAGGAAQRVGTSPPTGLHELWVTFVQFSWHPRDRPVPSTTAIPPIHFAQPLGMSARVRCSKGKCTDVAGEESVPSVPSVRGYAYQASITTRRGTFGGLTPTGWSGYPGKARRHRERIDGHGGLRNTK
jgi:hypothetical protein